MKQVSVVDVLGPRGAKGVLADQAFLLSVTAATGAFCGYYVYQINVPFGIFFWLITLIAMGLVVKHVLEIRTEMESSTLEQTDFPILKARGIKAAKYRAYLIEPLLTLILAGSGTGAGAFLFAANPIVGVLIWLVVLIAIAVRIRLIGWMHAEIGRASIV